VYCSNSILKVITFQDDGFSCCIYALANGDKLNVEKTK